MSYSRRLYLKDMYNLKVFAILAFFEAKRGLCKMICLADKEDRIKCL